MAATPQESRHWTTSGRIRTERQSGMASFNSTRRVKPNGCALRVVLGDVSGFRTLLILRFLCVYYGLYQRKLEVRSPKTRPLCLQSVKRRLSASTSFPSRLFPSGSRCDLQLRRSSSGRQLQTGLQVAPCRWMTRAPSRRTVSATTFRGARKDYLLVEATPCLFTPRQSLTLCPPRPMCTIV